MLERIHHLAKERVDFVFETTLASRTFAPWIHELKKTGYTLHLIFLWLPNPELALGRIAERGRMGGHNVPEEIVRRRYKFTTVCHSGLDPESSIFLDSRFRGNDILIPVKTEIRI